MAGRLQGKAAIVTGAGAGLGRTAALRFAAEGARTACVDVDPAAAADTAAAAQAAGGEAIALTADVSSETDVEAMVDATLAAFGTIDVLYANAGITGVGSAADCTLETWNRVIAVNLTGVWLCSKHVLPHMVAAGGGSIINQASVGGLIGVAGIAPYAAAKAGVIGLTRQTAVDYGPHGVRVNAICPGTIPTDLVTETYRARAGLADSLGADPEEGLRRVVSRYPLRRLGTPEDNANLAVFLASDESAWITGGVHVVDGGLSAA